MAFWVSRKWWLMWPLKSSDKVSVLRTVRDMGNNLSCESFGCEPAHWDPGTSQINMLEEKFNSPCHDGEAVSLIFHKVIWGRRRRRAVTCLMAVFVKGWLGYFSNLDKSCSRTMTGSRWCIYVGLNIMETVLLVWKCQGKVTCRRETSGNLRSQRAELLLCKSTGKRSLAF